MKSLALLVTLFFMNVPLQAQQISGEWHGSIEVADDAPLRLALHIANHNSATLDSVDEGVTALTVDSLAWTGSTLEFRIGSISGVYKGKISEDGTKITGIWRQNGASWPLNWLRGDDPANIEKPMAAEKAIQEGRNCARWFYDGKMNELWQRLSPVAQQVFSSERRLDEFRQELIHRLGAELRVVREDVTVDGALQVYRRTAQFQNVPAGLEIRFGFNPAGMVAVFSVDLDSSDTARLFATPYTTAADVGIRCNDGKLYHNFCPITAILNNTLRIGKKKQIKTGQVHRKPAILGFRAVEKQVDEQAGGAEPILRLVAAAEKNPVSFA